MISLRSQRTIGLLMFVLILSPVCVACGVTAHLDVTTARAGASLPSSTTLSSPATNIVAAEGVARDFMLALTNFDARSVNQSVARLQNDSTPRLALEASEFFGTSTMAELSSLNTESVGSITGLTADLARSGEAEVQVTVGEVLTDDRSSPTTRVSRLIARLSLGYTSGGWHVSALSILPMSSP
jgi:hypothetical protein